MTVFMAADVRAPRKSKDPRQTLTKQERLNLATLYYHGDDAQRSALVKKWGKGRMRRCLKEFALAEIDASFQALRMRDDIPR